MLKLKCGAELSALPPRQLQCLRGRESPGLADGQRMMRVKGLFIELMQIFMQMRTVSASLRRGKILRDRIDHITAEAVNAHIQPIIDHFRNFAAHCGIVPVQIRLLFGKQMQIILPCFFIPFPCAAAKV